MNEVESKQDEKDNQAPRKEITVQVSKRLECRTDVRAGGDVATISDTAGRKR
jgi:hypothetical protein